MPTPILVEHVWGGMTVRMILPDGKKSTVSRPARVEVNPPGCRNHVHFDDKDCFDIGTPMEWL